MIKLLWIVKQYSIDYTGLNKDNTQLSYLV